MKKILFTLIVVCAISVIGFYGYTYPQVFSSKKVGEKVDSFNSVNVYYNGSVGNVEGRNMTKDGYNLGLKYQCVEFVKRYYYEALDHKMPDSYGHAKDFFNKNIKDGGYNKQRSLTQYTNNSNSKPKVNDLVVYGPTTFNSYGHVSIISKVSDDSIEIIQQNPGPTASSRATYDLQNKNGKWKIEQKNILGWLRK
ncbi:CHAP domain-containing protein [Nonlabens antarcticus]|uniref:CHAP domain-containing protein n=1 Tax=Nonlabens antarcticus TaxID=392714 RepID=UPI0018913629|nr:CHAP domain-containing protein [Nonlabens antarcticus]